MMMEYPSDRERGFGSARVDRSLQALLGKIIECQAELDRRAAVPPRSGIDWRRVDLERQLRGYKAEFERLIQPSAKRCSYEDQ